MTGKVLSAVDKLKEKSLFHGPKSQTKILSSHSMMGLTLECLKQLERAFSFLPPPLETKQIFKQREGGGANCEDLFHLPRVCMLAFLYPFKSCKCKTSEPRTYENLMPPPVLTEYLAPTPVLTCLVLPDQSPRKNV